MYAPSPLSAVFALQMLYGSPALLCHGKVSVCFRSPPSLSSLCKMLTVFSHPISLISFSCNVFCLVSQCIHAKGQYFKLFEYTKLLRYHYDRRPFCQNIFFSSIFLPPQILYYIFAFCMVSGFICWVWFCHLVGFFWLWLCNHLQTWITVMILLTKVGPVLVFNVSMFCEGVPFPCNYPLQHQGTPWSVGLCWMEREGGNRFYGNDRENFMVVITRGVPSTWSFPL